MLSLYSRVMSGFTIYETLRIFVPGALSLLIADLLIRLSTGVVPHTIPASMIKIIESPGQFVILSVATGIILYLVDPSERIRIFNGDPYRGFAQPSTKMREIVSNYNGHHPNDKFPLEESLSLYFLFSDRDLPNALHQRVYLFGAVYKIAVDVRVLVVSTFVACVPVALAYESLDHVNYQPPYSSGTLIGVVCGLALVTLTINACVGSRISALDHQSDEHTQTKMPCQTYGLEMMWPLVVLSALSSLSVILSLEFNGDSRYWGALFSVLLIGLWFAFEIGPSEFREKNPIRTFQRYGLHSGLMHALGILPRKLPQFPQWIRAFVDLVVIIPAIVGAMILDTYLGRPQISLLWWVMYIAPALLILMTRKHERRLLGAYRHQNAYLDLSQRRVEQALSARKGL